jgi:hypothetical protein
VQSTTCGDQDSNEISSDVFVSVTEDEWNVHEEGQEVKVMFDRWLHEPLNEGPYVLCYGWKDHLSTVS